MPSVAMAAAGARVMATAATFAMLALKESFTPTKAAVCRVLGKRIPYGQSSALQAFFLGHIHCRRARYWSQDKEEV